MWTKDEYYNFIVPTVLDNQYEIKEMLYQGSRDGMDQK